MRLPALLLAGAHLLSPAAPPEPTGPALAAAAAAQIGVTTAYDPSYRRLAFPGGDVPAETGVCADVVVRALRTAAGVDLQLELNRDMKANFAAYPANWGLKQPDPNIDHRRVPNLMRFLERRGRALPAGAELAPGDIVAWRLPGGLYHIGVVAPARPDARGAEIIHNIGAGARREQARPEWTVIGRYRW